MPPAFPSTRTGRRSSRSSAPAGGRRAGRGGGDVRDRGRDGGDAGHARDRVDARDRVHGRCRCLRRGDGGSPEAGRFRPRSPAPARGTRSEEHTSELQSLMRTSYAVFCLKKKKKQVYNTSNTQHIPQQNLYENIKRTYKTIKILIHCTY